MIFVCVNFGNIYRIFPQKKLKDFTRGGKGLALSRSQKKMGKFEEAIPTYAAAMVFGDLESPMPSIHIAECLAALGRADDSERILRPILDSAKLDSAFTDIRRRAENLLSMLRSTN